MVGSGRLRGKVAVVTGGAQGIGAATVGALLAEGARTVFLDRDAERGRRTAAELTSEACAPLFIPCDVSVRAEVDQSIAEVLAQHGRLDVLVNNAGVAAYFDAAQMSEDDWDGVFLVDLKAVWLCCRAVLPAMRAAGSGSIVNISSIHARMTSAGSFPYAAAKSGVSGLTRSLALDEGPRGIRVNAVCPGYTRTRLVQDYLDQQADPEAAERTIAAAHPLRRIAEPAEVAAVVAFLACDEASYVTGTEVYVDGGLSARFAT